MNQTCTRCLDLSAHHAELSMCSLSLLALIYVYIILMHGHHTTQVLNDQRHMLWCNSLLCFIVLVFSYFWFMLVYLVDSGYVWIMFPCFGIFIKQIIITLNHFECFCILPFAIHLQPDIMLCTGLYKLQSWVTHACQEQVQNQ